MMLHGSVANAVGWALLHLLWQGVVVAGILAAALGLLSKRSANARYLVSCSALAALFLLAAGTAIHAYEPAAHAVAVTRVDSSLDLEGALPGLVLAWMTGVALLSIRLLFTFLKAHRLARSGADAANEEWLSVVERLSSAMNLRRPIRLVQSISVDVPSVIGWLRPVILVPAMALTGLSPRQLEMIFAHELAHIRRHDFFVNLLQSMVETLLFYHPAVWWMSHRIRIERENCCDDLAVAVCGDALQYARALARLEELRAPQLAVAANGGTLLDRIRRIAGIRPDSSGPRWTAALATLAIIAVIVAAPSLPAQAQREEKKPEAKKAATVVDVTPEAIEDGVAGALEEEAPEPAPAPPAPRTPRAPRAPRAPRVHVAPAIAVSPAPLAPPAPPVPALAPAPRAIPAPRPSPAIAPMAPLPPTPPENVTPAYVREMRSRFPNVTLDDVIDLAESGVTAKWLDDMTAAGVEIKNPHAAASLRDRGVNPEFIREK